MNDDPRSDPAAATMDLAEAIRPAQLGDAPGIGIVHAKSRHATYRGLMSDVTLARVTVEERTQWWTRALKSHDDTWLDLVAEVDGEIVGFSCTGPTSLSGSVLAPFDLYCLYMLPSWERRGFGRALVRRTFSWLRARGVTELQVRCLRDTPAHRFYEAMGGRLVEEGEYVDDDGTVLAQRIYLYDLCDLDDLGGA